MTKKGRLKKRWQYLLYGFLGKWLIKCISLTCRFNVKGLQPFLESAKNKKCILMLWHNRLAMMREILKKYTPKHSYAAFISDSRDGEILSYLTESSGIGRSIRVPHDARAAALQTLIKEIKNTNDVMIITPDGPKGPLYKIKPGIVFAAAKTESLIFPLTWQASRSWKLPTWDGLLLPKPFSRIDVVIGNPIQVKRTTKEFFEEETVKLETALNSI